MKTSALVALAAAAVNVAAIKYVSGPDKWPEAMQFETVSMEDAGIPLVKRDADAVDLPPKIQTMPTRNPHIPNSKTVKIRYGPYTVPGARVEGGEGMINNRPSPSVDKPCSRCMILGMNAGLEYPDGADANTNTKMWLHHMVMFNIGKGANDATCPIFGAPHLIVGSMPSSSERIFSSGNERTTTFFNPPWGNVTNLGYPIYPADRFGMIVDLMNMNMQAKESYLTIYYDFIDGHPKEMQEVKPVWMDAAQCGTSEISGRTASAAFDFVSPAWIANFEGEVTGTGGHLHDGGTKVEIIVDKKIICTSVPTYGTDEEALERANIAKLGGLGKGKATTKRSAEPVAYPQTPAKGAAAQAKGTPAKGARADPPAGGAHSHAMGKHIIAMSICADNKAGINDMPLSPLGINKLVKGQSWVLKAYYDYNKYPGMRKGTSESMSTVMGISIMYAKTANKRVGE
ncbi:hypothetical protein EJ08DRAFT_692141 [Tothia fuscella]|uniref:Uncharacterized protein n=1 Tax=Tothia fuscella TaxID=1048955 RepID=A0A9P4U3S7_9PEZI|nr:hypothetical protein EJ08DRAFT_692141 [Tothia fuscella]